MEFHCCFTTCGEYSVVLLSVWFWLGLLSFKLWNYGPWNFVCDVGMVHCLTSYGQYAVLLVYWFDFVHFTVSRKLWRVSWLHWFWLMLTLFMVLTAFVHCLSCCGEYNYLLLPWFWIVPLPTWFLTLCHDLWAVLWFVSSDSEAGVLGIDFLNFTCGTIVRNPNNVSQVGGCSASIWHYCLQCSWLDLEIGKCTGMSLQSKDNLWALG